MIDIIIVLWTMIDIIMAWYTNDSVLKIISVALGVPVIIAALIIGGINR